MSYHDTGGHVVDSPLWDSAVEDSHGQVGAPVAGARVEGDVPRHTHILVEVSEKPAVTGSPNIPSQQEHRQHQSGAHPSRIRLDLGSQALA